MSKTIIVNEIEYNISENKINIIQIDYSKTDILKNNSLVDFNQDLEVDLYENYQISSNYLKNYVFPQNMKLINKINSFEILIDQTNEIIEIKDSYNDFNEKLNTYLRFLKLVYRKKSLENELKWANLIENQSKNDLSSKKINIVKDNITELEEKISKIEPNFNFMNNRVKELSNSNIIIQRDIKNINKQLMNKTSETNKISREIDKLVPATENYNEKIDELKNKFTDSKELEENKDFLRISQKNNAVKDKIEDLKKEKLIISQEIKDIKTSLLDLKKEQKSIAKKISEINPKFKNVREKYEEYTNDINSYREKLKIISNDMKNSIDPDTPNSIKTSEVPTGIRISHVIEKEIDILDKNLLNIRNQLNIDVIDDINLVNRDYFLENIEKLKLDNSIFENRLEKNEITDVLKEISGTIGNMEDFINNIIKHANISINIQKLPITYTKSNDSKKDGNIRINFMLKFHIFGNKNQEIQPQELSNFQKLLIIFVFRCYFYDSINSNTIIFDDDIDSKLTNKTNITKLIDVILNTNQISKNLIKNSIVLFLHKKKFEENEIEKISIFSDKSE